VFRNLMPFNRWPAMTLDRLGKTLVAIGATRDHPEAAGAHVRILTGFLVGGAAAGTLALLLSAYIRAGRTR
jgi:hypothetical protein